MILTELRLLIPALLGRRYVLCVENDEKPDVLVRPVVKWRTGTVVEQHGTFRYKLTDEHEYRVKPVETFYKLHLDGHLGVDFDNRPKWHWKPFCPFGIGKDFPLFTQYLAKQLAG